MSSSRASLPLSRFPDALAHTMVTLEDGRADPGALTRLRPAPTPGGAVSAVLRDLQAGLPPATERRLLQALDRPGRPPEATLAQFWSWASPDVGGRTVLDELARDRCALLCSLWSAVGERAVAAISGRADARNSERAVVQLLRDAHRRAAVGQAAAASLADPRGVDARIDAAEAYLRLVQCPARRRLGPLLLAWSAPAELSGAQLTAALTEGDAAADAHAPALDDVRLLAQRLLVRTWARPVALAGLRQLLPTFMQGCRATAGEGTGARNPPEGPSGLMLRLDALLGQPDEVVRALARDARRLPWSDDPALVRAWCTVALVQLDARLREGAMALVCAKAPRRALQAAACPGPVPGPECPRELAAVRRATLYGAFSVMVGATYLAQAEAPEGLDPSLALRPEEFFALVDDAAERGRSCQVPVQPNGPRAAGLRVLNAHAGSHEMKGPLGMLLVHAALGRPKPIDGAQMVALLEVVETVRLQGRAAARTEQVRYNLLLRLLLSPLPASVARLRPVLRALLGEHACEVHREPPSLGQAQGTVEVVGRLLDRSTSPGGCALLCLAVAEATSGMTCRAEALVVAAHVGKLDEAGWEALATHGVVGPGFAELSMRERLDEVARVVAADAGQPTPGEHDGAHALQTGDADAGPASAAGGHDGAGDGAHALQTDDADAGLASAAGEHDGAGDGARALQTGDADGEPAAAAEARAATGAATAATAAAAAAASHAATDVLALDPTAQQEEVRRAVRRAAEAALEAHAQGGSSSTTAAGGVAAARPRQRAYVLLDEARRALRSNGPPTAAAAPEAAAPDGEPLERRLHGVAAGGYRLERRARRTLQESTPGPEVEATALRRAAALAAEAAAAAQAALAAPLPASQLQALQVVAATERTLEQARQLVAALAAAAPPPTDATAATLPQASVAAGPGPRAPTEAAIGTEAYAVTGPLGYVWRPAAGRAFSDGLEGDAGAGPVSRLRGRVWRELRRQHLPGLLAVLTDCGARLDGWLLQVGHSSADHGLRPGELQTLEAAAATLDRWRRPGEGRSPGATAVRLAAALAWRAVAPAHGRPYWADEGAKARHPRALFGVLAGIGCPRFACAQMHFGQLARIWVQARQEAGRTPSGQA